MASASTSIQPEIGLQVISDYLATPATTPEQRYIVFNESSMTMEMKKASPTSTPPLHDVVLERSATGDPVITVKCLSGQIHLITQLYSIRMHSASVNDSLHPNDLQAKLDIAGRCHLVLEDARTLEDLPDMATSLGFTTVGEPDLPTSVEKPKQPLLKRISSSFKGLFSSKKQGPVPVSARLAPEEYSESRDSGVSAGSAAAAAGASVAPPIAPVVRTPSAASLDAIDTLRINFGHFERLLRPLEETRTQLARAKDALNQLCSELDRVPTEIFEDIDFDKILDEKEHELVQLSREITTLEGRLSDIEGRKNDLQAFFRQQVSSLRENEEFQADFAGNEQVSTLLDRLETIGNEESRPLAQAVVRRDPLQTIREKRLQIRRKLEGICRDLSTKIEGKDPNGLLLSWDISTGSFKVESKYTLFGTAKVFIPLDDGKGIYCREGSEREIQELITVIRPNVWQKGAIRNVKTDLYTTLQRVARKK